LSLTLSLSTSSVLLRRRQMDFATVEALTYLTNGTRIKQSKHIGS
jgi:hypothetical protein